MKKLSIILITLLAIGCKPEPKPIQYGSEACEFCRMTIVDDRYAAQLVSEKNKNYSFDAIECMIHFKQENKNEQWALEMVTPYTEPGELAPVGDITILRTKELPSPMGMYLTAIKGEENAREMQIRYGGKLYQYAEISEDLENLPAL